MPSAITRHVAVKEEGPAVARSKIGLHDRSTALLEKLVNRLPAGDVEYAEIMSFGGETGLLVDVLAGSLFNQRIPITPDEYAELCDILSKFKIPVRHGRFINNRDEVIADLVVRDRLVEGPVFAVVASELPGFDAFEALGHDELRHLESIEHRVTGLPVKTFDWVLLEWATSVLRLESDSTRKSDEWNAWTVDDLLDELRIRDAIEAILPELDEPLRLAVERWVSEYDRIYLSFTVEDSRRWIVWKAKRSKLELAWWWYRIPEYGPVAVEYESFITGFEEWKRKRAAAGGTAE
ncbi:hypothetical protein [Nocardia amamiensis]|uniref:hypothetical protein n=1 Tax=Nocardia amamiensis TaxID=404578 RepID=UPI0012F4C2CA|nr:hypothetical protein [Nocardia amamiensis]